MCVHKVYNINAKLKGRTHTKCYEYGPLVFFVGFCFLLFSLFVFHDLVFVAACE